MLAQGVVLWAVIAAVAAHVRRPGAQIGAAWQYTALSVVSLTGYLLFVDLPSEVLPIVLGVLVLTLGAFFAHPSPLRARFTTEGPPSIPALVLLALAAIPALVYAAGQFGIHGSSGVVDEHWVFGHWIVMMLYPFQILLLGLIAALRLPGGRVPARTAGLFAIWLGVGSLAIGAVSQLTTTWAALAIAWGGAFIITHERLTTRSPRRPDWCDDATRMIHRRQRRCDAKRETMTHSGGRRWAAAPRSRRSP